MPLKIGILSLQGNFSQHATLISYIEANKNTLLAPYKTAYSQAYTYLIKEKIDICFITSKKDIHTIDGLIIPGGESSTIIQLIQEQNIQDDLLSLIQSQVPTLGTCAGCIILAKKIFTKNKKHTEQYTNNKDTIQINQNEDMQSPLAICDISIERNSYGRQVFSFFDHSVCVDITLKSLGIRKIEGLFIRAPRIIALGSNCKTLFVYNKDPVIVQHQSQLLCTFHPEAVPSPILHTLFLLQCAEKKCNSLI